MGKTSLLAPGFRFHPTDVELVMYYLKRKVMGKRLHFEAIAEVDLYKFAPWDLPDKSLLKGGDLKWSIFCPVEKKYSCGARMNRATEFGYWKTTGKDRPIHYNKEVIFHRGKAPRGERTDWVMHEYKLEDKHLARKGVVQNTYVLCMIFQKEGMGPRNGAQYGALFKEEDWNDDEQLDCVETVPSADLLTPTYVLPTNHSNSVVIGTSFLGGTVSESCLSETMPTCCERLPTRSSDVVYQASGDSDILPEVLAETVPSADLLTPTHVRPTNHSNSVAIGTSFLGGTVSESCVSETMLTCCERLPTRCSSDVVYQASGDSDILPEVLANSDDDILPLLSSFTEDNTLISIEDDQNKNLSHGNAEPALYFDADNFHQDSRDPGNTAGLSEDGYSFYDGQEVHLDHYFRTSDFLQPMDIFRNWG